ncbi:hypothetical protein HMPREF3033_00187 [Veillonellaceae bacterium DNF00751]|nr:hypothetical protein HMPREF3033_00187 [Veillonellaceae bacterium DNF00751]DAT60142.1 MAG TPA: hypothetical protein [Caudoviricetes sp.]
MQDYVNLPVKQQKIYCFFYAFFFNEPSVYDKIRYVKRMHV